MLAVEPRWRRRTAAGLLAWRRLPPKKLPSPIGQRHRRRAAGRRGERSPRGALRGPPLAGPRGRGAGGVLVRHQGVHASAGSPSSTGAGCRSAARRCPASRRFSAAVVADPPARGGPQAPRRAATRRAGHAFVPLRAAAEAFAALTAARTASSCRPVLQWRPCTRWGRRSRCGHCTSCRASRDPRGTSRPRLQDRGAGRAGRARTGWAWSATWTSSTPRSGTGRHGPGRRSREDPARRGRGRDGRGLRPVGPRRARRGRRTKAAVEDLTVRVWESPYAFGAFGAPVS